jgi:IS30 family transposase
MAGPKYSAETKQTFFDVLDRGGTVRAAAKAVGVHEDAAYSWVRAARLTMGRPTPRVYTAEEKAEFFRLLEERQNVSAVARDLGLNRVTCYSWAHKAGIFTSEARKVNPRRERFLRLRADGMSRSEATAAVRADARSAADWDKGITVMHRGRIYPDGRVVRYPAPKLPDVSPMKTAVGARVSLARLEQIIHSRYLSLIEREQLRDYRRSGLSIRSIAEAMGRSPSTISRELRRNTVSERGYMPHTAHRLSVERRRRPRCPKLLGNDKLFGYVQEKMKKRWSPEQISHRLRKEFPDSSEMRVSAETIYQAIYVHARGELKRDLARQLRRRRLARKTNRNPNARRPRFVDPMASIGDRPAEVEDRAVPGHWEGDLIVGAGGTSAMVTLVERSSRLVLLGHLGKERNSDAVRDSLVQAVSALPEVLRQSLTWDQGAEMSEHRSFSVATDMAVYFCDPGSPWQRGSNENTNGLLRDYFPKGTDLSRHTPDDLARVAAELNGRPRKSLDWATPAEHMSALLAAS